MSFASALSWVKNGMGNGEAQPAEPSSDESSGVSAFAAAREAIAAQADKITELATKAAQSQERILEPRRQAFYDVIYLVAAADGAISADEQAKLVIGLRGMLGESFDESAINDGLNMAKTLRDEKGLQGAAAAIAEVITDAFERNSLTMIASTVAWLGGGVGTKEGLALQAVSGAFGMPIKSLHEIMGAAHKIAHA